MDQPQFERANPKLLGYITVFRGEKIKEYIFSPFFGKGTLKNYFHRLLGRENNFIKNIYICQGFGEINSRFTTALGEKIKNTLYFSILGGEKIDKERS